MSYKILWYSLPSLHDNSNGAAIHNKVMLEALAARGFQVKALNALVADDPRGLEFFNRIEKLNPNAPKTNYIQFTDSNVEYIVARTKGHVSNDVTAEDQGMVFDLFVQFLEKFNPDVVIGYSGDCFSALVRHEAKARGIPVVYALCNGLHRSFAFPDCDLVFTPSEATAKMYKDLDGTDVKSVGQFIYKDRVTVPNRDPAKAEYVTLINPTPEKGLAIFAKIAQVFRVVHPEQKFLVVKSVGDYYKIMQSLHTDSGQRYLQKPFNNLANISVAEHTDDIRLVYEVTKVLVTPSVWHEAWGCVATEATFNGIPVLAANNGGLPEAVGEGGILLDAPEKTKADYYRVPTNEEIMPWVEALERLLTEDWSEKCKKAAERNDLHNSIDRLLEYLMPLMEKGSKEKATLERSFFFSAETMKKRKAYYEAEAKQAEEAAKAAKAAEAAATDAPAEAAANDSADAKPEVDDKASKAPAKVAIAANEPVNKDSDKKAKSKTAKGDKEEAKTAKKSSSKAKTSAKKPDAKKGSDKK